MTTHPEQLSNPGEIASINFLARTKQLIGRVGLSLALSTGIGFTGAISQEVVNSEAHPAAADTAYPWADAEKIAMPPALDNVTWGYKDKSVCDNKSDAYNCSDSMRGAWYFRDQWGYDLRNCTSYVSWRVHKEFGINVPNTWGNADTWDTGAMTSGYTVDKVPEAGDIAQWDSQHVAFVEEVFPQADGSYKVRVSEYNQKLDGNHQDTRIVKADNYIDLNGTGVGVDGASVSTTPAKAEPEPQKPGDPYGNLETIRRTPGGIRIQGWALDPDDPNNPTQVDVYAGDGYVKPENYKGRYSANLLREDVGLQLSVNSHRGFDSEIYMEPRDHRICVYGINVGPGTNRRYDCMDASVSGTVTGNLEQAFRSPGGITLKGWALDPDTSDPVRIDFYESRVTDPNYYRGNTMASRERGDVVANLADRYAGYSPYRGFDYEVPVGSGLRALCAFAVNKAGTAGESSRLLGCHDPIDVTHNPKGWFEGAYWTAGGVAVRGWALDPDSADKVDIHFYGGDGSVRSQNWAGWLAATTSRIDIVPSNPGYGDLHGFSGTVPAPPGTWNICAYAINKDGTPGNHLPMGCKPV